MNGQCFSLARNYKVTFEKLLLIPTTLIGVESVTSDPILAMMQSVALVDYDAVLDRALHSVTTLYLNNCV